VKHDDQTKGDEEKLSRPAPVPKDQHGQKHEHPRHRRQDQYFEELLKNKHERLIAQGLCPELGKGTQDERPE
jgi:hypothetical protein